MKAVPPNQYRFCKPGAPFSTTPESGMNGLFYVHTGPGRVLKIIASDGTIGGWEHVSISTKNRTPTWEEMCKVKSLFWDEHETVLQFHPKETEYVNVHNYCLHLWKKVGVEHELPPAILV